MPTNLICFGDSITHAITFPEAARWTTLLSQMLQTAARDVFQVHNKGIGGNTSLDALARFGSDVAPLLPGIVILEFGLNDAAINDSDNSPRVPLKLFRSSLDKLIQAIKTRGGYSILVRNHSIANSFPAQANSIPFHENVAAYNLAIKEVSLTLKVPLIDLPQLMSEKNINLGEFLDQDGLHLTQAGNKEYATMIFNSLPRCLEEIKKIASSTMI